MSEKNARTIQSADKVHTEEAVKKRGEVFTPTSLVKEMLDKLPQDVLLNPQKTVGDISGCGDGQFLVEVLRRRIEAGIPHKEALFTIYGIEIDEENANKCRERLLMGSNDPLLKAITRRNIICGNPLNRKEKEEGWTHVGWEWKSSPTLEDLEAFTPEELETFRPLTREEHRKESRGNGEQLIKLDALKLKYSLPKEEKQKEQLRQSTEAFRNW